MPTQNKDMKLDLGNKKVERQKLGMNNDPKISFPFFFSRVLYLIRYSTEISHNIFRIHIESFQG